MLIFKLKKCFFWGEMGHFCDVILGKMGGLTFGEDACRGVGVKIGHNRGTSLMDGPKALTPLPPKKIRIFKYSSAHFYVRHIY